jgi:hypothetical protein
MHEGQRVPGTWTDGRRWISGDPAGPSALKQPRFLQHDPQRGFHMSTTFTG